MSSEHLVSELRRADIKPLPTKASGLLRLAVHDARKLCQDSRFTLDLTHWLILSERHCTACLAGATLLRSTGLEDLDPYYYGYLGPEVRHRDEVVLIDALRRADWPSIVALLSLVDLRTAALWQSYQRKEVEDARNGVRDAFRSCEQTTACLSKDADPEAHQAYNRWFAALLHFARVLRKNGL